MNKLQVFALMAFVLVLSSVAMTGPKHFRDGVYQGESRSKYTSEPYWGQVSVEIKNDKVTLLSFQILDKEKNEVFGPDYERHFKDNAAYIDQCRQEVKGIKAYTEAFLKTRSMEQVDAITGATWSYNIFKDALNAALEKAKNN
jgi:major membrane immunogen (membrane-anchored lipoprotein)